MAVIKVDRTGTIAGAIFIERLGIALLRLGAVLTRPWASFGYSHGAQLVRRLLPSSNRIRLALADDAIFEMPYADGYWGILLARGTRYESDVEIALLALADADFFFIDCGANYGYWSVLVTSARFGRHKAVAIEAAPDTFAWLEQNSAINSHRFDVLHRAVAETSGRRVTIRGAKHEVRSIAYSERSAAVGHVETITLDDIATRADVRAADKVVLKLDVEGVEIAALRGATALRRRDLLIVYEDHGSDREHSVTVQIMDALGMRVFYVDALERFEINSVRQLDAIKKNRRRGYNFFAANTGFWTGRLDDLVASPTERRGVGP